MIAEAIVCLALNTYHEAKNQSFIGQVAVDCLSISGFSQRAFAKSVLNKPGAMALVLMLWKTFV